jgi:2'-5' RNA ligase
MTSNTANGVARVFYALVPPPSLQFVLAECAREAARRAHGRPVPADNIHLTLAFVGAWPVAALPALLDIGASLEGRAMRVMLDRQGGFRRAGIAWIGTSAPPAALTELAGSLGAALLAHGVAIDGRPFHAHLTLARKCRGPYAHDGFGPLAWDVDHFVLMQSDTRAEGARYSRLASWPLRSRD